MGKHFFYKSEGAAPVEDTSNEALPGGGERARWYGTGETRYKVLLTVNGNACSEFYVPFLNGSPTPDPVVVPLSQEPIRRMARRYNGMYELMFVMSLKDTDIAGDARWRTVCNLEFNGNKHYLGPLLFSDPPAESAMLVEEVPSKLTLYFAIETRVPVGEKAASYLELLLAAHVAVILAANPYGGSMAFSHLRNDVSWLPFFTDSTKRFSKWKKFILYMSGYYNMWCAFHYTPQEIKQYGFYDTESHRELRVVSKRYETMHLEGDLARNELRCDADREFRQKICELKGTSSEEEALQKLKNNDLEQIRNWRSYKTLVSRNYKHLWEEKIRGEGQCYLYDKYHPLRMDYKRKGVRALTIVGPGHV
ncbi:hypothetical protein ERJ75_001162000 [Trypanosoma vivax]|nr:hypothetical protein ERJ75_001162000 [Trypanosoma vivax]